MNNKKVFAIGILTVLIAVCAIIVAAVGSNDVNNEQTVDINVYFLNPTTKQLSSEKRNIQKGTDVEVVEKALNELLSGPKNSTLAGVMPKDVKILKCTLVKSGNGSNTAEVSFSREYKNLKESQELYCRSSVVWTLTEFDFIDNVHIYIEDEPLLRSNGQVVGDLNRDNVVLNPVISPDKTDEIEATLYFSDDQEMKLWPEKRRIEVKQSETKENKIVEQLIVGPNEKNLYPTIPTETKIRNIKTEEGICYVDLSSDFVTKHWGGSSGEILTIYSIVNSLTELENVKKVQFLIEGEKVSEFKGHVDFSKTFERDEDIILKDK